MVRLEQVSSERQPLWVLLGESVQTRMESPRLAIKDDNILHPQSEQLCVGMIDLEFGGRDLN